MVVHVDAQLKPAHLLRCSTDGRAAGHGPAATPDQLVCTVHHSSCASSVALQRHLLRYDTGIESREQLGQVAHVNAQATPARLLAYSTDGRAAGHGPAPTPRQLARSTSVVLAI